MENTDLQQRYKEQSRSACVFCIPSPELVLHSTENFHLVLDPFALTPGHLLITSRDHYGCLGEVPRSLHEECSSLRNAAIAMLKNSFQQPVLRYEHGRAGHCIARGVESRSCHHYHEHLVPAQLSLHNQLENQFKWKTFDQEVEVCTLFERYEEYLLVVDPCGEKRFYITNNKEVEPHLLRTLSAQTLGVPDLHDWEAYQSCKLMLEGKKILQTSTELAIAQ